MKKLVQMRCPNCNGRLDLSTDKDFCFCPYCGEKILITDDAKTTININRDEAEIEKQKVKLEEIRLRDVRNSDKEEGKQIIILIAMSMIFNVIMIILLMRL